MSELISREAVESRLKEVRTTLESLRDTVTTYEREEHALSELLTIYSPTSITAHVPAAADTQRKKEHKKAKELREAIRIIFDENPTATYNAVEVTNIINNQLGVIANYKAVHHQLATMAKVGYLYRAAKRKFGLKRGGA